MEREKGDRNPLAPRRCAAGAGEFFEMKKNRPKEPVFLLAISYPIQ